MKKIISLFFAFTFMLSMVVPVAAAEPDQGMYVGDTYITEEVRDYIIENGIDIQEDDYIELVDSSEKSRSSSSPTALRIVQKNGDTAEEYLLLSYEETANGEVVAADVPLESSKTRTTTSITYKPGKGLITIVGMVGYTVEGDIWDVYLKPYGANFTYSYNQSCTVNSINISYQTEGTLCDAAGNAISSGYIFYIEKYQNNPVAGQIYQANRSLPNGQKILYTGNISSGVWLTIEATVNGNWDSRTYNMAPVG